MDIRDLQKKYELSKDDFWEVRGGTWVVKHDAVERIANIENIVFEMPVINTDNGITAMIGEAYCMEEGKQRRVWSVGEASVDNVKMAGKYFWSMAEKRLKDRLTLKLINAYEFGVYSDSEADAFQKPINN
jgi:hypothetical protein